MRRLAVRVLVDDRCEDLDVRFDDGATIGELAERIRWRAAAGGAAGDGSAGDQPLGLVVAADTPRPRFVPPTTAIADSGLHSGQAVRLGGSDAAVEPPVATLSLLAGPDAPARIELHRRTVCIGRGSDSDVRLSDPLVSRRHARLHVGAAVEVVDDGSANGIVLAGRVVDRAVVRPGEQVVLGDTVLSVAPADRCDAGGEVVANEVAFNRPPRVDPAYEGVELVAPEPPQPPMEQRFPVLSLLVPILMAVAIYAATQSVLAILFVGLSPLMVVGSWLDTRAANRRQLAQATAAFRSALRDLEIQLDYARALERAGRCREHPGAVDVLEAAEQRSALLWSRRPEHDRFAEVRLGIGTRRSRNTVAMPSSDRAMPELAGELRALIARFGDVAGVPVVADLRTCGNVGVAGPAAVASAAMRGLLVQFAGLHSPAEMVVACVGCGDGGRWDWLTWLPHARLERGPLAGCNLAGDSVEAAMLAAALDGMIEERLHGDLPVLPDEVRHLPVVLVIVDDDAAFDRARLVQLAERGPVVGVHVAWSATSPDRLPAPCRAFLDLAGRQAVAGLVVDGETVAGMAPEQVGAAAAERFARLLSPLADSGAAHDAQADLPGSVSLLELTGREVASNPDAVVERWRESRSLPGAAGTGSLRALVGRSAEGPLHLDLRADGPHALVGGTTGSGKSELLQTWVAALAVTHSPARVTFLLVDYKGGAAFADCVDLPHCVGLVTDLDGRLVRRALRSLDAELRRREQLLRARQAKDLLDLERRGDPDCPPRLVVVVDEFAALVAEVPEFVDGVVNVAQRGRSLGLHLILATQRPAGVVSDHVRANTDLRIALRMADGTDSTDVVGSPVAAAFDRSAPGRAVVTTGPGWLVGFQCAHVGGTSAGHVPRPAVAIRPLRFGGDRGWDAAAGPVPAAGAPTDLALIVRSTGAAAERLGLASPRRPWLPELATVYPLVPSAADELTIGLLDDPDRQSQPAAAFRPDVDGNIAVFGTGGSGKTTVLRTIAAAAASATAAGAPCWVYGVDFGARGLQPIEVLPNVGSVVTGDDHERVVRLLRRLGAMLDERAERYAAAGAATLGEYRRRTGRGDEPRVVLLLDGVGAFRAEYEGTAAHRWWEALVTLAACGRGVGIHLVLSADRPAAVSSGLAAAVQRRLVLRLASDIDVAMLGLPADAVPADAPPGRGWLDGCEVQVAVPGGAPDMAGQAVELQRLAARAAAVGSVGVAPAVGSLPARVVLADLPPAVDGLPIIGLSDETLGPTGFDPEGTFVVAGPPRSGRTATVVTIVRSLTSVVADVEPVLLGRRRSALAAAVEWSAVALGVAEIDRLAGCLAERVASAAGGPRLLVVVEAIGDLLGTEADPSVHDLVRACRDGGALVVAESETGELAGSWPLLQAVKAGRTGIVLQPDQLDGEALFKTAFPRIGRGEYPPGRGLLVRDGRVEKVQVALS